MDEREPTPKCGTCRFFERELRAEEGEGHCRRHAPSPVHHSDPDDLWPVIWPIVDAGEWCGEWRQGGEKALP